MKILFLILYTSFSVFVSGQNLVTPFETSAGKKTATYTEAISFYKALSKQFNNIFLKTFNSTDAGEPLHLALFSVDSQFDPQIWHKQGKVVILINNGIHAGEPDGIDASMMLLRDLATGKVKAPANVVLAIVPVYNIGGALNRGSFSRVNQQGPESYGFRGNARNYDLNRDFTKNDTRNARAFATIFHYIDPDIFMDNHVSDGADYQHVMTLLTTQHDKLGGEAGAFLHDTLEPALFKKMENKDFSMTPYVDFAAGSPVKGWTAFYDAPRYSSGYTALFQTIGFMPETHMLKPFDQRVRSTYALMQSMIEAASEQARALKSAKTKMIERVVKQKEFALEWNADTSYYELIRFKGYESGHKTSDVTGLDRLYYDQGKPFDTQVKFYNRYLPGKIITLPRFYIIPQGWWQVLDLLKLNQVKMKPLQKDTTLMVEVYRIEAYKSLSTPYEGHHRNYEVQVTASMQPVQFRKGDMLIECNQRANRYLAEMLEPTGDDSFFAWNFFDTILQQKEGYSAYRWEDVAAKFLENNPAVKQDLEAKKKADPAFAASASAQLQFVYKHSPYYEAAHLRYPVFRWNP